MDSLNTNTDIQLYILSFLPLKALKTAQQVCKTWYTLTNKCAVRRTFGDRRVAPFESLTMQSAIRIHSLVKFIDEHGANSVSPRTIQKRLANVLHERQLKQLVELLEDGLTLSNKYYKFKEEDPAGFGPWIKDHGSGLSGFFFLPTDLTRYPHDIPVQMLESLSSIQCRWEAKIMTAASYHGRWGIIDRFVAKGVPLDITDPFGKRAWDPSQDYELTENQMRGFARRGVDFQQGNGEVGDAMEIDNLRKRVTELEKQLAKAKKSRSK